MKAGQEQFVRHDADAAFRAMADSTPAPVWITGAAGGITFVNQAFADLTGLSRQRLLGDAWISLLHPDDLPAVLARREEVWSSGHAPYEFVARFRDAAGCRWVGGSAASRRRAGDRSELASRSWTDRMVSPRPFASITPVPIF